MGLFSKKKTYVESLAMPLVEDTPNYVQQSVLTSVRGERPIAEDLISNVINGLGANLARYYKYGRDEYTYGLPEGTLNQNYVVPETVKNVLDVITTKDTYIDYCVFGSPNAGHFAEDFLENTRGWDRATNIVANPPFTPVGTVTLGSAEFTNSTTIKLTYNHGTNLNPLVETEDITVPSVQLQDDYYHVSYFLYDAFGNVSTAREWWFYRMADNTYDVLNVVQSPSTAYYPVVPLRHNSVDLTVDDGSDRYNTSKKLLQKLDLRISELGDGLNSNPDVNDIDHAYVMMGVSTQTTAKAGKDYLYRYFKYLSTNSAFDSKDYSIWDSLPSDEKKARTPPMNKVVIREADISYHVELGYLYIVNTITTGSIGGLNAVDTQTLLNTRVEEADYAFETSELRIRKQVTATTYETLSVYGLKHINYVYGSHTIDTSLADAVNAATDPDDYSDGMIIPLNHSVLISMALTVRTELAYDAFKIVFNCITVLKLKWYQTEFFKFAAIIVSIALTIMSFGSAAASLTWAAGLVGASSAVVGAVVLGALLIGAKYGIAYLVDALGIESALLIAIVVAISYFIPSGYIDPSLLTVIQSGLTSGSQLAMDWEMTDIRNDYDALQREIEEAERELQELNEGLGTTGLVDPFAISNSTNGLALPNETPEQYYNTRIHFGNMASVAPLAVTNYVDNELHLEGLSVHYGIKV